MGVESGVYRYFQVEEMGGKALLLSLVMNVRKAETVNVILDPVQWVEVENPYLQDGDPSTVTVKKTVQIDHLAESHSAAAVPCSHLFLTMPA
jgi:hypothetical protein